MTTLYCPPFVPMAGIIVPAESGSVTLDTFTVDEAAARFENLRAAINGRRDMLIDPGEYARLRRNGGLWMSDTPAERNSNLSFVRAARGDVLVLGLGIAMVPVAICRKEGVTSVTVVEIDADVIAALVPTLARAAPTVRVVEGDAFLPERTGLPTTKRGGGFDVILADIWPTICSGDYPEHIAVRRAWKKWLRPDGRHLTWHEDTVKSEHRRERSDGRWRFGRANPTASEVATGLLKRKRAEGSDT